VVISADQSLGAEEAASDDGMISGILDLSYMGVYTVWMNDLGTITDCSLPSLLTFHR